VFLYDNFLVNFLNYFAKPAELSGVSRPATSRRDFNLHMNPQRDDSTIASHAA